MVNIISRKEWGAKPPTVYNANIGIVDTVFFHHTVTKATDDSKHDARIVQEVAFGRGFSDISYIYLIHPNGDILEGRIYNGRPAVGAHTQGYNATSIAISYIGDYSSKDLTAAQVVSTKQLLNQLISGKVITSTPRLLPHNKVYATACPARIANYIGEFKDSIGKEYVPLVPEKPAVTSKPAFPLPVGHWFGMPSKNSKNHSGHYVADRTKVMILQQLLNKYGYKLAVDGFIGSATKNAIMSFQKIKGLAVDGLVGQKTWDRL